MTRFAGVALSILCACGTADAADSGSASQTTQAIDCGGTRFTIRTRYTASRDLDDQTLIAHRPNHPDRTVDLGIVRARQDALDAPPFGPANVVVAWRCLHTPWAVFLTLTYECNQWVANTGDSLDLLCDGDMRWDWTRYVGLDGMRLDPGYAIHDRRYPALFRRLGWNPDRDDGQHDIPIN